jgi:hypothetical protein
MFRPLLLGLALRAMLLRSTSLVEARTSGQVTGYIIDQTGLAVAEVFVSAMGRLPPHADRGRQSACATI